MAFTKRYLGGPLALGGGGAQGQLYCYDTTDTLATVTASGYFAEMGAGADPSDSRGMSKGDLVVVRYFDALPAKTTYLGEDIMEVVSIDSDGDVTVGIPGAIAVTATADGLTTGLIPSGARTVAITSGNAAHIVTLPAPAAGKRIIGFNAGTACEIRSVSGSINTVAAPNELLLAANSWFIAEGLSSSAWVAKTITQAGAVSATDIPDA